MTKVALYARYSSDNQRDASIEDQLRLCRLHAERQGWTITDSYTDRTMSGASLLRPGIQELIQDATRGMFAIVLAEAMDRLSRDQEDIAGLFKRMGFAGVKIVTLAESEVSALHVGLKGTMNALFLKELRDKTHRGLRGRVELGKSGGGNAYGYDVVRQPAADGPATHDALQQEETRPRAAELIRSLVSRIVLTPAADGLRDRPARRSRRHPHRRRDPNGRAANDQQPALLRGGLFG
ncbi:recombinase family protein [Nitrospirillum amazonense]|uniref:DNA invertase Pin-like site-specific DNA recombinase n=1 Tax=Nitrospirillum amazonense TaxID=28077 RepID=A0A560JE21_9PROT|nr:DNA invertase Pin-like site-specific DNA recombinase [Nitrospirillum amazonense]